MEVEEYVKHPGKFALVGGKRLKGMIMTGGLGTGKTLLSKTIAAEARVPSFIQSRFRKELCVYGSSWHFLVFCKHIDILEGLPMVFSVCNIIKWRRRKCRSTDTRYLGACKSCSSRRLQSGLGETLHF
ncbi:hypothetical protein C5167_044673 [Papaver somniferum]|nr:hypothetical protein C5167_044673 [Papaver somniferum]